MDKTEERKLRKEREKQEKLLKAKNKKVNFNIDNTKEKKKLNVEEVIISTVPGNKKDVSVELPKSYSPIYTEEGWFSWWEKQGYFKPEYNKSKSDEKFVIMIPPPNVTGVLHIGHALTMSVEDCFVRYNRMLGKQTLWLPGTDHAGIATQTVIEKKIMREQGKTRHDLGRNQFVEEIWKWKEEKGGRILTQLKQLGSSCDFSRLRFTMDESMYKAVTEAFIRLYKDDSIYRAKRLVNWSCSLKSAISDIEVEKREITGRTMMSVPGYIKPVEFGVLVHFAYKVEDSDEKVFVATTRIETMLGDTAVAVHPQDSRYKHLHNKYVIHPFASDRKIPIVCDEMVDMEFGTGAVKMTPAHDHNDYEVGKRHNLDFITIFSDDGLILDGFGEFSGMKRFDCRRVIMKKLEDIGLIDKVEPHNMVVPICTRSKDIIEPMIKNQWYLKCSDMAKEAVKAVKKGDLKLLPEGAHDGTWNRWMENVHDWCISRQLWWGHRIPMYRVRIDGEYVDGNDENCWISGRNDEEARCNAKSKYNINDDSRIVLEQDPDVLDTWFSSQLFPFSTMGWPEKTTDLDNFYPGTLLETGHDILFFWVARMVMIGLRLTGKLPFSEVYLHAMVRDAHGRKMSKSLGNVLDPYDVIKGIDLVDLQKSLETGNLDPKELQKAKSIQAKDFPNGIPQCGTDALRFALISYTAQPRDINLDVQRVFGYRTFCNKLWQAYKYCAMFGVNRNIVPAISSVMGQLSHVDKWILSRLSSTVVEVVKNMNDYNISNAASAIHRFWIYDFCDIYIEYSKEFKNTPRNDVIIQVMIYCLNAGLRILHPMMPFITEELFQRLPLQWNEDSICVCPYPVVSDFESLIDVNVDGEMTEAMDLTKKIRSFRKDKKYKDKDLKEVTVLVKNDYFAANYLNDIILPLSKCKRVEGRNGELIFECDQMNIYLLSSEVPEKMCISQYFTVKSNEEFIKSFDENLKQFNFYTFNTKEELLTKQWCNWLNQQYNKGKSCMKETVEFVNEYMRNVTYLADTRCPSVADSWLLKYLEINKVNDGFISKYVNLKRWFDTVNTH